MTTVPTTLPDLATTLVVAVEISKSTWLAAAHIPGLSTVKAKQVVDATGEALAVRTCRHGSR